MLEWLQGATQFTKLDLREAYNLVQIQQGDEWKTIFGSLYGQYEYLVMPFSLCNALAVFQGFMNDMFQDLLDQYVIIYPDDNLIYTRNSAKHTEYIWFVLAQLRQQGLYAKLKECKFGWTEVKFPGHYISPQEL